MTIHDIRHRLVIIANKMKDDLRGCGYTQDYADAIKMRISDVVQLGDDLDKSTGEERV